MPCRFFLSMALGAGVLFCAQVKADFSVSAVHIDLGAPNSVTTNGNGTIPGFFQMVEFFAKNLGTSGTGTQLATVNLTMSDLGAGSLVIGGYNQSSGVPASNLPADLYGQNEVSAVAGAYRFKETLTTTTNAPKYVSFVNILGDPSVSTDNSPNQLLTFPPTPANTYANYGYAIKSFSASYGSTAPNFGVNATTANGGLGALFAVAVVPFADSVNVQGQLAGNTGNPANFNFTTSVVPGDANLNGTVDVNDYNAVIRNFGTGTTWTQGDFGDGSVVSITDYNTVVRNFGHSSPGALPSAMVADAVPEPTTLIGVTGICFGMLLRRVRRPA